MKYNYLLFDLDGTLFDYDKAESEALKNTFVQLGLSYDSAFLNTYREINHLIWQDFENGKIAQKDLKTKRFDQLSDLLNIKFDSSIFSDKYLLNLSKGTSLIEGSEETLKKLNVTSKLYLITNGLSIVQRPRIKNSVIGKYFDGVIISDSWPVSGASVKSQDIIFNIILDVGSIKHGILCSTAVGLRINFVKNYG